MSQVQRRRAVVAAIAVAGGALTGCSGSWAGAEGPDGYTSQMSVEAGLRGQPNREAVSPTHLANACRGGSARACSTLGVQYELGLGVDVDHSRATELYNQACRAGNEVGCVNLADALVSGHGIRRSPQIAEELLVEGCKRGHAPACGKLGAMYVRDYRLDISPQRTHALLVQGCDGEHYPSCLELGMLYERSTPATNVITLVQVFERACEGGQRAACTHLAGVYERHTAGGPSPSMSRVDHHSSATRKVATAP